MGPYLILLALCLPSSILAIYEDQAGSFDWHFQHVGPVSSAALGSKPRVFVGTSQKVVSSLNLRDGTIAWRKLIGEQIVATVVVDEVSLLLAITAGKIMAFDQAEGGLRWEHHLHADSSDQSPLLGHSISTSQDTPQIALVTAKSLQVSPNIPCAEHPHARISMRPPSQSLPRLQVLDIKTGEVLSLKALPAVSGAAVVARVNLGDEATSTYTYVPG